MRRQAEKLTRGVDDVDALVLPKAGGGRRSDGDAPLLLLRHPVHGRAALVHLADLVGLAGIEKDALGGGGLAGVNVRHDSNVAFQFVVHRQDIIKDQSGPTTAELERWCMMTD
eukprot:3934942-Rhodomonas_salina.2